MIYDYPEFGVREQEDGLGLIVDGPDGEELARFAGSSNPAFLAFLEGLKNVPGASVWSDAGCRYLLQGGEVTDISLKSEIEEMMTPAAELRAKR